MKGWITYLHHVPILAFSDVNETKSVQILEKKMMHINQGIRHRVGAVCMTFNKKKSTQSI